MKRSARNIVRRTLLAAAAAWLVHAQGPQVAWAGGLPVADWQHQSAAAGLPIRRIAVFGTDDRRPVPPNRLQVAEQIGLFFSNPSKTVCSAFCVAPNIIATAAHCLARPGGKPARIGDFMFARGYDRKREFSRIEGYTTGSTAQSVIRGNFQHRIKPPIDAAHDWALVRLSRAACPGQGLPVSPMGVDQIMALSQQGRIFQVSYHRDWTQWRPAYSGPCLVGRNFGHIGWETISPDFLAADQMILHQCDTGGASSGSPMLVETGKGIAVVGINVGTYVQAKILSDQGRVTLRERAETVANTAVNAHAFAEQIPRLRRAALLASGEPLRELQGLLAARNFYKARIDGSYGPMLKAAIEGYERASRLPVTGLPTMDLMRRLQMQAQGGLGRVAPTSAPRHPPPPLPRRP